MEMTKIVFQIEGGNLTIVPCPKAVAGNLLRDMLNKLDSTLKAEINNDVCYDVESYEFTKKHEFHFNFKSGGWNSIYAQTRAEAIAEAKAKYNDEYSQVKEDSFNVKSREDSRAMLRNFW